MDQLPKAEGSSGCNINDPTILKNKQKKPLPCFFAYFSSFFLFVCHVRVPSFFQWRDTHLSSSTKHTSIQRGHMHWAGSWDCSVFFWFLCGSSLKLLSWMGRCGRNSGSFAALKTRQATKQNSLNSALWTRTTLLCLLPMTTREVLLRWRCKCEKHFECDAFHFRFVSLC